MSSSGCPSETRKARFLGSGRSSAGTPSRPWYTVAQILRRDRLSRLDVGADPVGAAVDRAAANARAGQQGGVAVRPVPPTAALPLEPGRPAELARQHHERAVHQAALDQVFQRRRHRLVQSGIARARPYGPRAVHVVAALEILVVHVPQLPDRRLFRTGRHASAAGHADQAHAGLDQPPREKKILPERMPAVAIADPGRLLVNVEGAPRACGLVTEPGALLQPLHVVPGSRPALAGGSFQPAQQREAVRAPATRSALRGRRTP